MSDRISALAANIVDNSDGIGGVSTTKMIWFIPEVLKFVKEHRKIQELLNWETGEKMIDNRDGPCLEVDERRDKKEQVAFVTGKLQEDPATFALAQEYYQLVSSALKPFQLHH